MDNLASNKRLDRLAGLHELRMGANLYGANLSGANLSGENLSGEDLSGANLSGANLSGAILSGANLSEANLSDANLSDSFLDGACLDGVSLDGAKGIISFGPVGEDKRIGYAVRHKRGVRVQLGCFWGPEKMAIKRIAEKYGARSPYAALVKAACRVLMSET